MQKLLLRFVVLSIFCLAMAQTSSAQKRDTIPATKLIPAKEVESKPIADSLLYDFKWAEGVTPPKPRTKPRMAPVYYLDGKEVSGAVIKELNTELIDRIDVWKDAEAEKRHKGSGKAGLIIVHLKKNE